MIFLVSYLCLRWNLYTVKWRYLYCSLSLAKFIQPCSQDPPQSRSRPFPSPDNILLHSAPQPGNHCSDFCYLLFSFKSVTAVNHNHRSFKVMLDSFQNMLWTTFHDVHDSYNAISFFLIVISIAYFIIELNFIFLALHW